ncbi:MAG: MFS transporter [Deltaproteobacteria bacterium]|nr:MFS transporter [Deltaproteobacteria bacterium]
MHVFLRNKIFYGWFVAGAGFLISVFGLGARYSYGVFLKSIEADLGMTRAVTSSIFSVYMLLGCLMAVLGGWCMDRYGPKKVGIIMGTFTGLSFILTSRVNSPWQLFITYSLLFSLGTGAVYVVANSTASRWFVRKRGLVVGFTSAGGGVGTLFIAPFAAFLISSYHWRTAFITLGFLTWVGIAAVSLLFKKDPRDIGLLPDGATSGSPDGDHQKKTGDAPRPGFSLGQAYRMSQFWLLGFSWAFLSLSMHLIFVHIVPYAIDTGISPMDASFILSLIGIANIMGRVTLGKLSDIVGRKPLAITCDLVQCVALIWLMWARQFWMLYAFSFAFGFTFGASSTQITILVGDIFGTRSLGAIMGILTAGFALGAAIGPAVGGFIFDVSGHYFMAFATGAIAMLLAAGAIAFIRK